MLRFPLFAGRHYFADAGRLRASVESFIEDAGAISAIGSVCALIVPHGPLVACGAVAGFAYKLLLSMPLAGDAVTLLAPTYRAPGGAAPGGAAPAVMCDPAQAYATPLGELRIADEAIAAIGAAGLPVERAPDEEAIIENHLPFVQVAWGDGALIPLRLTANSRFDASRWQAVAGRLGPIIAIANLPPLPEQMAVAGIERLDEQLFDPGQPVSCSVWGRLFRTGETNRATSVEQSADAAVLAAAIQLAKARGANRGQMLKREGAFAAFALCRLRHA